jgi:protein-disulfide isomerase
VKGPGAKRQASPKVLIGAAVAVGLIILAVVLGFVLTGGNSSSNTSKRGSLTNALPGASDADRLLKGIPQSGNVLGSANAPVTMVEYVDLQCPFCQQFETQVMPKFIPRYVRNGKVKVEARPIAFLGPDSVRGREGALAAAQQNRMFNFMQLLYDNQGAENTGWLNDAMITAAAASIPGLDVPRLLSDRGSSDVASQARQLDVQARDDHVSKTPTIYIGKTGQHGKIVALASPTDLSALSSAIARASTGG